MTAAGGWRRAAVWAVAAAGLGYLAVMATMGAMPVQRQLIRSEAKGVLKLPPEQIHRVELQRGDERLSLTRSSDKGWTRPDGTLLAPEASKRVSMAIQMLHRSGPVREIAGEELKGVDSAPFGLDAPRVVAALYADRDRPVLTARFGGQNPEDFLQYMRLDGDAQLYLMSRFIGTEWLAAMTAAAAR